MSTEAAETPSTELSAALDRLNARLDHLEAKVDRLTPAAPADGLGARLADAETQRALGRLLDRLDKAEAMIDALGTLGQRLPILADAAGTSAAWAYDQAVAHGVDPIPTGQRTAKLALAAASPELLDLAERLVAKSATLSAVLDALDEIDDADLSATANALVQTRASPIPQVGPISAFFRLGDPDVKRAIGFSLELAKRVGAILGRS